MKSERWRQVSQIYHDALARAPHERAQFLAEACTGDEALRDEVESLLGRGENAEGFLSRPAVEMAAHLFSGADRTLIGRRLGAYRIDSRLGAGGMGEVYRARDTKLGRDVAIKVLPATYLHDPERQERFEREARLLASLNHPNIAVIHGIEDVNGGPALVLELVEGVTLAERLAGSRPIPVSEALQVARQIAAALEAAHAHGIIHRDLKPANIKVTPAGVVKVLDFGLAKALAGDAPAVDLSQAPTASATGTLEGVMLGTPAYMSPEQVRGKRLDKRTDIWSFGCVLYEALTGRPAFAGETLSDTIAKILAREPDSVRHIRRDVPPKVERVVRRCLEKDRDARYASGAELLAELTAAEAGITRYRRRRAIAGLALATAVTLTVWLMVFRSGPSRDRGRGESAPIAIGAATQITAEDGLEIDPTISPDGKLLAYAAGQARQMRIFIRPVMGGRTITLSEDSDAFEFQPRWSPDGSQILYLTRAGAFATSALGGVPQRIASSPVTMAAWLPDGKRILLARDHSLSVAELDGTGERPVASAVPENLHSCNWSSQGDWIACTSGNRTGLTPGPTFGNIAPSAIVLGSAAGGPFREVTDRTTLNQSPVWSPDGRHLYFVSNRDGPRDIYVLEIQRDGRVRSGPHRVSTGLGVQSIAFSATGQRLAYVAYAARANIWSLPIPSSGAVDTSGARAVTSGNQIVEAIRVSRDRHWLLYDSTLYLNAEIFRVPIAGGTPQRLTADPADDFAPDLSPDGREVAYHSFRSGTRDIFVKPIDGGPARPVRRVGCTCATSTGGL